MVLPQVLIKENVPPTTFALPGPIMAEVMPARNASSNPNGNIYAKADEVCKPRFHVYSSAYQQCFMNELAKYPAASNKLELPRADAYLQVFVSPAISFDFAGLAVLTWWLLSLADGADAYGDF